MNKQQLVAIFSLAFFLMNAQPQKEAWHWRFGQKCGLNFSSGSPVQEPGLPVTWQFTGGSGCISDASTGQYQLATNGIKVFNKNNAVMSNGYNMAGNVYAGQHLITPDPGNSKQYYVFTCDVASQPNNGVHYSVVDITQQGGLGAVTLKNQVLTPGSTAEKITAVRHCNGKDYWILTHPANSNAFNAYLLTGTGISTTPVVSNAGTVHMYQQAYGNGTYREGFGDLKAAPNGKKVAIGIESDSIPIAEIFDFNNATGVVSNPITIRYTGRKGPWSLSFSPDNSKFYTFPHSVMFDTSYVYQYDLSSGIPSTITNSETLLAKYTHPLNGLPNILCGVQMAPDRKLYVVRYSTDTLAVINDPNNPGLACNFQYNGPVMPGSHLIYSLPNFIDANYAGIQLNLPDMYQCGTFTSGTIDAGSYSAYQWSTGATTQTLSVTNPGKYWVTVTNDQGCQRTDTVDAYIVQAIKIDTAVCDSFPADVMHAGATQYIWYDSTTNPVKNFVSSGSYYVDVTFQGGCTLRDSITVSVIASPKVDLGPPLSLCDFKLDLNAGYPGTSVMWSTGATTTSITVNEPGTYWVTLTGNNGCTGTDTLVIGPPWQLVELSIPNVVTPNDDKINDEIDFEKFQFETFIIRIYNRWGQKVFESDSPAASWKPTVEDGTYFYTGQYKLNCGLASQIREIKGFITVIR